MHVNCKAIGGWLLFLYSYVHVPCTGYHVLMNTLAYTKWIMLYGADRPPAVVTSSPRASSPHALHVVSVPLKRGLVVDLWQLITCWLSVQGHTRKRVQWGEPEHPPWCPPTLEPLDLCTWLVLYIDPFHLIWLCGSKWLVYSRTSLIWAVWF